MADIDIETTTNNTYSIKYNSSIARKDPRYRKYTKKRRTRVLQDGFAARALWAKAEHSDEFKELEDTCKNGEFIHWDKYAMQNRNVMSALNCVEMLKNGSRLQTSS